MRALIIVGLILAGTGAAEAACVLRPDDASSRYVENNSEYMLCLQRELAAQTALANQLRLQQGANDQSLSQLNRQWQQQLQLQELQQHELRLRSQQVGVN